MPKYEVTVEINFHVPVTIVVDADDKDDALDIASGTLPTSALDETGWKGTVAIKPPKGVQIAKSEVKAKFVTASSGGEKIRKLAEAR